MAEIRIYWAKSRVIYMVLAQYSYNTISFENSKYKIFMLSSLDRNTIIWSLGVILTTK